MEYYIETHIVDHCNLNCAGCCHFSPLVDKPRFKNLEEFKIELKRIKEVFGEDFGRLGILGGEPLLHPNVEQFLIVAREIFDNKTEIALTTNGLLMKAKGENFWNFLNSLNIKLKFSDYGLDIDKTFIEHIANIEVNDQSNNMFNLSLNLNGTQNPEPMWYDCGNVVKDWYGYVTGGCWVLRNGLLYPCPIMAYSDDFERYFDFKFDVPLEKMAINIFTHNKEEILKFLLQPSDFCRYCNVYLVLRSRYPMRKSEHKIEEWIDTTETLPKSLTK